METRHKDAIQRNYHELVQHCSIDDLLPLLVHKKVFSREMITKYSADTNNLRRKRDLFLDIQMRGPHAFSNLVSSLRETGQNYLANLLDPVSNGYAPARRHAVPFQLPTNEEVPTFDLQQIQNLGHSDSRISRINLNTEPIRIQVQPSTRLYDDLTENAVPIYSTHSKNRGVVLIINNINYINDLHTERRGAEVDSRNLEELFTQIGLQVELHVDLTCAQMENTILSFKSSPKIKGVDMVFVIIMAHGRDTVDVTSLIGTDNKDLTTTWVEEQFDNAHCKALQNRPKIIMYQTCRGLTNDFGVARHIEIDSAARSALRTRSDMLIAHSTLPGHKSHRDIHLGTWYIQLFCEILMEHAHNTHMEDLYKMVDEKLAHLRSGYETMQTSMFTNVGFKTCYLHPKIYMEDGEIKSIHANG